MSDDDERKWLAEDLEVFKRAYALSLEVHRASLTWPKIEQYGGLADQVRRASKSVCGLIVEGVGRQTASSEEFTRYLTMAIGSAERSAVMASLCASISAISTSKLAKTWRERYGQIISNAD